MVLRKVGIARRLEGDAVHAVHIHGVGAHLHAHGLHALIHHLPEAPVQIDGVGGGHVAGKAAVADQVAGGADQAGFESGLFQNGLHQIGGGGFALGAAHAHHAQLARRVAIERRCDIGRGAPDIVHAHLRRRAVHEMLHHQRDTAVLHGLRRKIMRVKAHAADAEEQAVPGLFAAIGHQRLNLRIPARFQNAGHVGEQLLQ